MNLFVTPRTTALGVLLASTLMAACGLRCSQLVSTRNADASYKQVFYAAQVTRIEACRIGAISGWQLLCNRAELSRTGGNRFET
jgi:hypothetical protein